MEQVDVAVIGAGVVGLAVACELARPGRSVAVFERHPRHGMETSSRNSEVVHSGIYYPSGTLKARLCVRGREMIYDLCRRHGLFCRRTGKLIVACAEEETKKLGGLLRQGQANGVSELELIDQGRLKSLAPNVSALAALWSPVTGIVDSEDLMRYYLGRAEDAGALFIWKAAIASIERSPGGYKLEVGGAEPVLAAHVVNAAGLHADRVAERAGIDVDAAGYRLHWFKGEYFRVRRPLAVEQLVYPVPAVHGLGIHLTLDRQGRQRLGPNAFAVPSDDSPAALYDVDPTHRRSFWEAASRYLPGLRLEDIDCDTAGIRPKLARDGSFRDFIIAEESGKGLPGWVNLIGIESPGLTSSPAIAEMVARLLSWN